MPLFLIYYMVNFVVAVMGLAAGHRWGEFGWPLGGPTTSYEV